MTGLTLRDAIAEMPFSKSELAQRADVSRTTVLAAEGDESRMRVSTIRELALALGYDVRIDLDRASDPLAAAGARAMLGDLEPGSDFGHEDELDGWIDRLRRYSGGEPIGILREAARLSAAEHRTGSAMFAGPVDVDRLVSAGRASEARWALSGAAALDAMGADGGTVTVLWAEDAKRLTELLAADLRRFRVRSAAGLIVAPADPTVFVGASTLEDVNLVSPVQAIIDSIANGGADQRIAESLAESW
ncbi:helix-turn-helix domain-containing protein [Agromyces archimandritae]|uniref:Helix-turn-helix transcriptional regulator n=1 Tax=Agromyces archimandritae TaxID=2781962 RepID=A0A975IR35_9MICO|nr:helix-turn-helix transcriptional regulator [Agromyces archimandritae]QTX05676.1 helix-turn-helix transcriptional regulator [Agromyces archimandritae]